MKPSIYPILFTLAAQEACVNPDGKGVRIGDEVGLETAETDLPTQETDSSNDTSPLDSGNVISAETDEDPNFLRNSFRDLITWGTQNPDPFASAPIDLTTGTPDSQWVSVTNLAHQSFNASMEASLFAPPRTLDQIMDLESGTIVFHVDGAYWVIQKPERLSLDEIIVTPINGTNAIAALAETSVYLQLSYPTTTDLPSLCPNLYRADATEYLDQFCFKDFRNSVDQEGTIRNDVGISKWASDIYRIISADDPNYDISSTRTHMDALQAEAAVHEVVFGEWFEMGLQNREGVMAWTTATSNIPAVYLPAQ